MFSGRRVKEIKHINIFILYDLYVEIKGDIYLSKNKDFDGTKVKDPPKKTFKGNLMYAALVAIFSPEQLKELPDKRIVKVTRIFLQNFDEIEEELGITIDDIKGRPVFQHRTLAEYLAARWLCNNLQDCQSFIRDHLSQSGFHVLRSMVDKIRG